jgi:hypothetical protein
LRPVGQHTPPGLLRPHGLPDFVGRYWLKGGTTHRTRHLLAVFAFPAYAAGCTPVRIVTTDQFQTCAQVIVDAAPEHEQPGVLTRVERIWGAGSGSKAESVRLIVVAQTVTVERAISWTGVRSIERGHDCRNLSFPGGRRIPAAC